MTFTRMRIPKGSELLAGQVRTAIVAGELAAGEMLPSEKELMVQFGLSRATVREGLRLLEAEGFITTRAGRGGGALVHHPTSGGHTRSLLTLLQFDSLTYDDLLEAWAALTSVCGGLAARHVTAAQLAELHELLPQMAAALDDSRAFMELEGRFLMLITYATNNPVLRIYGTSLADLSNHHFKPVPFARAELDEGLAACRAILSSIEAGDAERATHRIARHLEAVGVAIVRLSRPLDERPAQLSEMLARMG